MRVLVVEDDDRVAGALCDLLGRHGFGVMRAAGVTQALAQRDDSADMVLLDLMLPVGDGFDLCARIRATRDVPIPMTTARSELRRRVHGLHLGADDYLVKPYDARELIARMLAVHRRLSSAARAEEPASPAGQVVQVGGVRIARAHGRSGPSALAAGQGRGVDRLRHPLLRRSRRRPRWPGARFTRSPVASFGSPAC